MSGRKAKKALIALKNDRQRVEEEREREREGGRERERDCALLI